MKTLAIATAILLTCMSLVAEFASSPESGQAEVQKPLMVFLVRHAEKIDATDDPKLSSDGAKRAKLLASLLRDSAIEHIHSSNYIRTRDTAAPVASLSGLEVELYDPKDLDGLAARLKRMGGRHLVVGHSNTTPKLVELLGGLAGPAINEKSEYDRLYAITVAAGGIAQCVLLRFGTPFQADSND